MATAKWWNQVEQPAMEWHELRTDEGLTYFHNVRTNETRWDRPRELMTAEHQVQAGSWVWLSDSVQCYVPAKIEAPGGPRQKALLRTESGRGVEVSTKELDAMAPLQWPSLQRVVADLTLLDDMNPALILHNLKQRFERDQIYTNIGTILISVNPYCRLNLYTPEVIDEYENRGLKEMPPHVFNVAHDAIAGIKDTASNQSVIVSGESGAGKTEATKQVLSYIAAVSGSTTNTEEKILLANPILETFGNAKTLRNNNSSRFGKYIQVYLNERGEICGSTTQNFLLEKVRVVNPAPNERNFHVFYQITEACSASDRARWGLGRAADFFYTVQSQCTTVAGIDDQADYNDMVQAMTSIGVSNMERDQLLQAVAAILHLGNVVFESTGDKECRIANADSLSWAASLFGVDERHLEFVMTRRMLRIRGQGDTQVSLSDEQAFEARDALAKFVYAALFDWIVARINKSMSVAASEQAACRSIGILDIFGFEVFTVNSFEQLCINFTNERLQQFFNANTFGMEEDLYAAEGIAFDHVAFIDNQPMVDLLTKKPFGIMNLLDEEVVVPQGSDAKFLHKIVENHSGNAHFKTGPGNSASSFVVVHYAGPVVYDVTGFLDKNRDALSPDAIQLLNTSSLAQMFACAGDMSAKDRKQSLGRQFRAQLDVLMTTLTSTTRHYVRCIKPNEDKQARTFVSKNCYEQLLYSGVFEAVQIRKRGFPFRQKHSDFLARYKVIFPDKNHTSCDALLRDLALPAENLRIGRTMILYRSEEYKQLELRRSITVRKAEIIEELRHLTVQDVQSLTNEPAKEKYFERLSKAVRTAIEFNANHPVCRKGRDMLIDFIESRMDDDTRSLLEDAQRRCDRALLQNAIARSDQYEYSTKLVRQCKKLLDRVIRIEEETEAALSLLERDHMRVVVDAARELGYWSETMEYYNQLLSQTPCDLLKVQLKQAVEVANVSRAIRLTIKMKDNVFQEKAAMFDLASCGLVKPADDWASEKFLTLHRDQLRLDMLTWSKDDLHSPLTLLWDGHQFKERTKAAIACFKQLQSFMGDRKSENPADDGHCLVITGHGRVELRDEIYVQILKQLTKNPNPDSARRGWQLLGACVASFPPGSGFENFLEVWLRVNAQNSDYLGALHAICYLGARPVPIELGQLDQITDTLRQRTQEYAERLPSGPPSYQDLQKPFDADVDELEFRRKAPVVNGGAGGESSPSVQPSHARKMSRVEQVAQFNQKGKLQSRISTCRSTEWEVHSDPTTKATYYWNPKTGVSSWEKPAELKFSVADDVKPRF